MRHSLSLLFLFFAVFLCSQDNATLISGALRANFGPGGALYGPDGTHFLSLEVDGAYKPLLFEAGLLLGGVDPGGNLEIHDLRGPTITPGIIGNTEPIDKYWRVTSEEIIAHQADFADNGIIDNPIPAIFAWPGHNNASFEEYNGFSITSPYNYVAPFWDINLNSVYEPEAGEYPILEIRNCLETPIVVTEMIFFPIMSTPAGASEPTIQIYMTAFRIGCEEIDNPINNALFLRYKIINRGVEKRNNYHFGLFADGDIGCSNDDYVGTFPDRFATYFYNANEVDSDCIGGQEGFGDNPPALAIDLFRLGLNIDANPLVLNSTMPVYNPSSGNFPIATADYNTPSEAYNYLQGKWRDGSPLLDEAIGYTSGNPANFAFAGDPTTGEGWSETAANNPTGDRRVILSSEEFTHYPGAVNEFIMGFTYNDDPTASNVEKISGLRDNVDLIQSLFDNCFNIDEFTSQVLGCSPLLTAVEEIPQSQVQGLNIYPNPANGLVKISLNDTSPGLLQIYQPNGQMMLEQKGTNGLHQIDVAAWPKGIYVLQWKTKLGIVTKKLVIQ